MNPAMLLRAALVWGSLPVLSGCAFAPFSANGAPTAPVQTEARALLVADLQRQARGRWRLPTDRTIDVMSDSSAVVEGLVYHWGLYEPPGTADIVMKSLVAQVGTNLRVVLTPADWKAVTAQSSLASSNEAWQACLELVHTTGRHRHPGIPPVGFESPASLSGLPIPDSALVARNATPPRTGRLQEIGWSSRFWAVEHRDVTEYRCEITDTSAELHVGKVLPNQGLYAGHF